MSDQPSVTPRTEAAKFRLFWDSNSAHWRVLDRPQVEPWSDAFVVLATVAEQLEQENATLRAENVSIRKAADEVASKALCIACDLDEAKHEAATLRELAEGLAKQLREIHAFAWGECPSLLNEDSGGNARLDMAIEEALEKFDSYRAACPGEGK